MELRSRLARSFAVLPDAGLASRLRDAVMPVFDLAWKRYLSRRDPDESPHEHEVWVHEATLRILSGSGRFREDDYLFGCLVALLHDLGEIRRVTEHQIVLARQTDPAEAERLAWIRRTQRPLHMIESAERAWEILNILGLAIPVPVRERTVDHIGLHDAVKLGVPYPPRSAWAEVCCVEADLLWPLSPEGPAADLRRLGRTGFGRAELAAQARANYTTQLMLYRSSFPRHELFTGAETFLRTPAGTRMLDEFRGYWGF